MKHIVSRMCFICRNIYDKNQLTRLVKNSDGKIFLDKTGKASGRGAYICNLDTCIEKLNKQKVLNRAFKCEIPNEVYKQICEELIEQNKCGAKN